MSKKDVDSSKFEIFIEKKKTNYVPDFKKLSRTQLRELLERQNRLIRSPALWHLSDKGEKVKLLKTQIEEELLKRDKAEDVCDALTKLSIHEKKVQVIEWGEKEDRIVKEISNGLPEDEKDPIALIATHSGTNLHNQIIKVEEPDDPLVTLADIEDAYALSLCNKIDRAEPQKKFLPYKTIKSTSDTTSKQFKVRDLSAATPPVPVFGDVKLITLEESIKLQYEQTKHLKEVQLKHASERLMHSRFKMGDTLPTAETLSKYREPHSPAQSDEETDEENPENI